MSRQQFFEMLAHEVSRIDSAQTSKRRERLIEGFTDDPAPHAQIGGREYIVFNSNDYLGLRHHPALVRAEHEASKIYGAGPGAVRFISGSTRVHRDLERALARFHARDDAMIFSSAFAANLSVLFALTKGQSRDSVVKDNVVVISDELNHRSIIDGIRLCNLDQDHKRIFAHLDAQQLNEVLDECVGKFDRAMVVTDGVFSMLGEIQKLQDMRSVIDSYDAKFAHGVLLIVDDCHGVGACGRTGRGTEEITATQSDVIVGTLGKGFGSDGGYVVAGQTVIDYLRESAAPYIYSNPISPATAAAGLAGVSIVDSDEGIALLERSRENINLFKHHAKRRGIRFAAESTHPIQPVLIGDPKKSRAVTESLFAAGILATSINYPVVPAGRDEIRVQISATHTQDDIQLFLETLAGILKV